MKLKFYGFSVKMTLNRGDWHSCNLCSIFIPSVMKFDVFMHCKTSLVVSGEFETFRSEYVAAQEVQSWVRWVVVQVPF